MRLDNYTKTRLRHKNTKMVLAILAIAVISLTAMGSIGAISAVSTAFAQDMTKPRS